MGVLKVVVFQMFALDKFIPLPQIKVCVIVLYAGNLAIDNINIGMTGSLAKTH